MNKNIKKLIKSAQMKIEVTSYQEHISINPIKFEYVPDEDMSEIELREFGDRLADFFEEYLPIDECRRKYEGQSLSPEVLKKLEDDIKTALYTEYGSEWKARLKDELLNHFGINPIEIKITIEGGFYE